MQHVPSFATQVGRQVEDEPEPIELADGETSLHFLQRIYRDAKQPMTRRLRAAIEALPFEAPKLSAVAVGHMRGQDFAALLEKAIARSGKSKEIAVASHQLPSSEGEWCDLKTTVTRK
jgi:hypothetical protein